MNAMELLTNRASNGKLAEPAPNAEELASVFATAVRAPDHGRLRPYRFFTVQGAAREALGALFARIEQAANPAATPQALEQTSKKPLRAPLIITVAAITEDHPKVPEVEQVLCAGTAAHSILLALQALGYGAIWRTGPMSYHDQVKAAFGLRPRDSIVGFLYVGTPAAPPPQLPRPVAEAHVQTWDGPR